MKRLALAVAITGWGLFGIAEGAKARGITQGDLFAFFVLGASLGAAVVLVCWIRYNEWVTGRLRGGNE